MLTAKMFFFNTYIQYKTYSAIILGEGNLSFK